MRRCAACGGRGWRLDLDERCSCQSETLVDLQALADEHAYIPSADVCGHCGDCECDGIGCIAGIDPDSAEDYDDLNELHDLLRMGRAWRLMQTLRLAGAEPVDALVLAAAEYERASNHWPLLFASSPGEADRG